MSNTKFDAVLGRVREEDTIVQEVIGGSSSSTAPIVGSTDWGTITGTLADQLDLQSALDLKANLSLLAGGTAGQHLAKNSADDYDMSWVSSPSEVVVDTRTNILALTPTVPTVALASDTNEFFIYDGTNWKKSTGSLTTINTQSNILASTPTAGSTAYSSDTNRFFVYTGSQWKADPLNQINTTTLGGIKITDDNWLQIDNLKGIKGNGYGDTEIKYYYGSWSISKPIFNSELNVGGSNGINVWTANNDYDGSIIRISSAQTFTGLSRVGRLDFGVYTDSGWQGSSRANSVAGSIVGTVAGTWAGTNYGSNGVVTSIPMHLDFETTQSGSVSPTLRVRVSSSGELIEYGSHISKITNITANYTLTALDNVALVNTSTNAITITLPTAVSKGGLVYTIKDDTGNAGTNNITVTTTSGQNIDGSGSVTISTNYGCLRVISNGANWRVI